MLIPDLRDETGIAFLHRIAAAVLFFLIFWLWLAIRREYKEYSLFRKAGNAAFVLVTLQILSGGLVVGSLTSANWYLLFSLIHTVLVAGLFGVLCYLSMLLWRMDRQGIRGGEHRRHALAEETADDHAGALVYNSNE
jgi:cytochrome c oxidase assembly protein subunit 15